MAHRIAIATGNYTDTATWGTGTNSPTVHASTNVTILTAGTLSATFTAPSTSDQSVGVIVLGSSSFSTSTTFTATLQEDAGGGFADTTATATITLANIALNSPYFFKWGTPYTFTTTAANRYRIKFTSSNNVGNMFADSGGTLVAYLHVDNRSSAAPAVGSSDQVWVIGNNKASALLTVTMTGTSNTAGNSTNNNNQTRVWTNSVNVSMGAVLKSDTASSSTTVITGSTQIYPYGVFQMIPASKSVTATYQHAPGSAGLYYFNAQNEAAVTITGTALDVWKTTYVSGVGTAASPLVIANGSADWAVGDQIFVFATDDTATNYNNCETRFIITKNSNTSYVLSLTAGGAEAALTATHTTNARIVNVTRNCILGSSTANQMGSHTFVAQTGSNTNTLSWARWNKIGTSSAGLGLIWNAGTSADYLVVDTFDRTGMRPAADSNVKTHTGLMAFGGTSSVVSGSGGVQVNNTKNKTFVDCMAFNTNGYGLTIENSYNCTFTRLVINAATKGAAAGASTEVIACNGITYDDLEIHASRGRAIQANAVDNIVFNDALLGTKGNNGALIDVNVQTDTFIGLLFNNLTTTSTTQVNNYLNMLINSEVNFDTLNGTVNNHFTYTPNGVRRSSGSGLADTTNRTTGNLTYRLAPETSDGVTHEYKVVARADTTVLASGYVRMNSAFQGNANTVLTAKLFLPGNDPLTGVADDTVTVTKTADTWIAYALGANYTGDVDRYATIVIKAINPDATSAAYVYHTDILNGTNPITGLKLWDEGKPSDIMFEQLGDAAAAASAVWGYDKDNSEFSDAEAIGKYLKDGADNAELAAIK